MVYRILLATALLFSPFSLAQTTNYGPALTEAVLKVQGAISPACNTTDSCVQLVTDVVPRCQKLQGDPGCWCGNHNPLHFCAICMSNPIDNRTTPDQTAAALEGHQNYHTACNAFEAALNASLTASAGPSSTVSGSPTTSAASSNSGSSKTPTGAIVGGAVGGGVAIAIAIIVLILWLRKRDKSRIAPSSVSLFSEGAKSSQPQTYSGYGHPQPAFGHHDNQYGAPESAFAPGYAQASAPYQTSGMRSPGLNSVSDGSYKKHPEPMTPAPGY